MNNPRLAGRYAKSLIGLAQEKGQLEQVYADIKMLKGITKSNPDFIALMKSPVVSADKKQKILTAVLEGKVTIITAAFIKLLVNKRRESNLPEIVTAFLKQYNELNNIHEVRITTAQPMSAEMQQAIVEKVKSNAHFEKIELTTLVKDELIGGFKLEVGDTLIDASILRDLKDVKRQFQSNEYIHNIR